MATTDTYNTINTNFRLAIDSALTVAGIL